jgi:hypothetical protein
VNYKGMWDALTHMARHEGWRGFYSGVRSAMAYQVMMNGARLGLYPFLEQWTRDAWGRLPGMQEKPPPLVATKVFAGAVAGAAGALIGSPFFLVKVRLQAQSEHFRTRSRHHYTKGTLQIMKDVFREGGVKALYRGCGAAVLRVSVGSAAQLASYDVAKVEVMQWSGVEDGVLVHVLASLVAGVWVTLAMNPFGEEGGRRKGGQWEGRKMTKMGKGKGGDGDEDGDRGKGKGEGGAVRSTPTMFPLRLRSSARSHPPSSAPSLVLMQMLWLLVCTTARRRTPTLEPSRAFEAHCRQKD